MLTKDEYLLRNFSKIRHKKWELFVITRVLHLLDDPDIEYVCQQYIRVKGNNHYLTDLCFPSLKLYYEIDEGQHSTEKHQANDKIRQREILEATDWEERRIKIYDKNGEDRSLSQVTQEVDLFIKYIKDKKREIEKKSGKKLVWDYKNKFNPANHIENGSIRVKDNVVLLNHRDCLKLFGYKSEGHFQPAMWEKGTRHLNQAIWFPKLYPNNDWSNVLSDDGSCITEQKIVNGKIEKVGYPARPSIKRIVFAHYKNIFGQTVYKFYGIYALDMKKTDQFKHIHRRVETEIKLADYS